MCGERNIKLDAQILGANLPRRLYVVQWHLMFVVSWYGPWFVTLLSKEKKGGGGLLNFWKICGRLFEIHAFIHSIGRCKMRWFRAVLRSFFHSSLLCTFSCHPSPPTILPSSCTSSCHLFLGLPLSLVVPKFIYNTVLRILFSSILCMCPNQRNLFNLIVSITVGF